MAKVKPRRAKPNVILPHIGPQAEQPLLIHLYWVSLKLGPHGKSTVNGEIMPSQHIGNTVLVVTMEVNEADEAEFNEWYNEQHLPERMAIPGYVSARRFKLEGNNNNNG